MIALATVADVVLVCGAGVALFWGYCAACDLVDAAIERLRGNR